MEGSTSGVRGESVNRSTRLRLNSVAFGGCSGEVGVGHRMQRRPRMHALSQLRDGGGGQQRWAFGNVWVDRIRLEVGFGRDVYIMHTVIVGGRGLILAETTDRKELTLRNDTEDLTERPRLQWVSRI